MVEFADYQLSQLRKIALNYNKHIVVKDVSKLSKSDLVKALEEKLELSADGKKITLKQIEMDNVESETPKPKAPPKKASYPNRVVVERGKEVLSKGRPRKKNIVVEADEPEDFIAQLVAEAKRMKYPEGQAPADYADTDEEKRKKKQLKREEELIKLIKELDPKIKDKALSKMNINILEKEYKKRLERKKK
jgi:hypothetical protein